MKMDAKTYCSLKFEERMNEAMVEHYKSRNLPVPTRESIHKRKESGGVAMTAVGGGGAEQPQQPPQQQQQLANAAEIHITVSG